RAPHPPLSSTLQPGALIGGRRHVARLEEVGASGRLNLHPLNHGLEQLLRSAFEVSRQLRGDDYEFGVCQAHKSDSEFRLEVGAYESNLTIRQHARIRDELSNISPQMGKK